MTMRGIRGQQSRDMILYYLSNFINCPGPHEDHILRQTIAQFGCYTENGCSLSHLSEETTCMLD